MSSQPFVRIVRGDCEGMTGTVIAHNGAWVVVWLTCTGQTVSVPRGDVVPHDGRRRTWPASQNAIYRDEPHAA